MNEINMQYVGCIQMYPATYFLNILRLIKIFIVFLGRFLKFSLVTFLVKH